MIHILGVLCMEKEGGSSKNTPVMGQGQSHKPDQGSQKPLLWADCDRHWGGGKLLLRRTPGWELLQDLTFPQGLRRLHNLVYPQHYLSPLTPAQPSPAAQKICYVVITALVFSF